ncbi:hypothetical protein MRX96_014884 [Rhipicephalus microplus]
MLPGDHEVHSSLISTETTAESQTNRDTTVRMEPWQQEEVLYLQECHRFQHRHCAARASDNDRAPFAVRTQPCPFFSLSTRPFRPSRASSAAALRFAHEQCASVPPPGVPAQNPATAEDVVALPDVLCQPYFVKTDFFKVQVTERSRTDDFALFTMTASWYAA